MRRDIHGHVLSVSAHTHIQYTNALNTHGGLHSVCSQHSHTVQKRLKHAQIHPHPHMHLRETQTQTQGFPPPFSYLQTLFYSDIQQQHLEVPETKRTC